jgi:hypothetical protein
MPHPTPPLAETWGPEGIYIYTYEERKYRKKIRTRYRHKEIDMHIQAQELHNGEVHM